MAPPSGEMSTGRGKSLMPDTRPNGGRSGKTLAPSSVGVGGKNSSQSPGVSSPGAAKKKKRASSSSTKSEHYTNYIFKLLRQTRPGVRITRRAMAIMNSFVLDAFERIAVEAGKLCTYAKKDTLTSNEIRTAVRLVLPGDLAKHAIYEGVQAVQQFTDGATGKRV